MRNFVIAVTSAAGLLSTAALAQEPSQGAAPIPNVTGTWVYPFCCGFLSPPSGPGPVVNKSRMRQGTSADGRRFPPGANVPLVSSAQQFVGDYTNPILKPQAAEAVKKDGDSELTGIPTATPRNQCWPEQVPFVLGNYGMQIIQQPDKVTVLYPFDHQFRQVRLNEPHPQHLNPSWYGDSVGRYEGDTLVVDTVAVKVGRFSMVDWFGTPFTEALHLVERYRLIDYEATKEAIARDAKEHRQYPNPDNGSPFDPSYKGKGLQIHVTVEDTGAFTMPWSATVTMRRAFDERLELVCAENMKWYPDTNAEVPMAATPDF